MKNSLIFLGILFSLVMATGIAANSENRSRVKQPSLRNDAEYVPGEIFVKFKPGVNSERTAAFNSHPGTSVVSTSRFAMFKRLKVPPGKTVSQMVAIYSRNPNVEFAEPNFLAHAFMVPDDPCYGPYQWHLKGIHMEEAWDISTGGSDVVVAVHDTGVAYAIQIGGIPLNLRKTKTVFYDQAPDLAGTLFAAGYEFVNVDPYPKDDKGHGTHVAGAIAQSNNNDLGVAGAAFGCSIMPIKVLNGSGSWTYSDIADGIYFAAGNGADVINMSLHGRAGSITLENALVPAYGKYVAIVYASGSDGFPDAISYPAPYNAYCIAVGAKRYDEAIADYSNRSVSLALTAPGGDVNVDQNSDGYGDGVLQQTHDGAYYTAFVYYFYKGTSMTTPHATGVAALLVASDAATIPAEIRPVLQSIVSYGWSLLTKAFSESTS